MWSEELQEQTREYFKRLPIAAMKKVGGRYGVATMQDGKFIIQDRETDQTSVFECIEELIEADWAID